MPSSHFCQASLRTPLHGQFFVPVGHDLFCVPALDTGTLLLHDVPPSLVFTGPPAVFLSFSCYPYSWRGLLGLAALSPLSFFLFPFFCVRRIFLIAGEYSISMAYLAPCHHIFFLQVLLMPAVAPH